MAENHGTKQESWERSCVAGVKDSHGKYCDIQGGDRFAHDRLLNCGAQVARFRDIAVLSVAAYHRPGLDTSQH